MNVLYIIVMIQHDKNTAAYLFAIIIKKSLAMLLKPRTAGLVLPLLQCNHWLNELSLQVNTFNPKRWFGSISEIKSTHAFKSCTKAQHIAQI